MKDIITIILFSLCCCNAIAQANYVMNPGLEQHWRCPDFVDQIKFANFWSPIDTFNDPPLDSFGAPNCTPEYLNICGTIQGSVPANGYYWNRYPHSGAGMAQVMMFEDTLISQVYQRDYLQGRLYKPLTHGKSYCLTFYVAWEQNSNDVCNHIGAYLDKGQIDTAVNTCGLPKTQYTPQVQANTIVSDTANWFRIEGSFTANGGEQFITIGNFSDNTHTSISIVNPGGLGNTAWYLVDDISVIESDHVAFAGNDTNVSYGDSVYLGEIAVPYVWYDAGRNLIDSVSGGIWVHPALGSNKYVVKQTLCGVVTWDSVTVNAWPALVGNLQSGVGSLQIFPNPNNGSFTISANFNNSKEVSITILNPLGQVLFSDHVAIANGKLNKQESVSLSPGIYTLRIDDGESQPSVKRLVIY